MTVSTVRVLLHTLPEYEHTLQCALLDAGIDISSPVKTVDFFRSIGSSVRETDFTKLVNYPYTLEVFNHRSDVLPYQSVHLRYVDGKRCLTWVNTYNDLLDYAQVMLMSKGALKTWIEQCKRKYTRPSLDGQDEEYKRYMFERCLEDWAMNIYAVCQGCTPEQTEELLSIIERANECTRIEVFVDPSDLHIWSCVFLSSSYTEHFEPSEQHDFTFFLGNERYTSSSECTVKYEKITLDDFISQAKSIILDLSLES